MEGQLTRAEAPKCAKHPRENGKSSPWNKCLTCWEAYLERRARECEEITPDQVLAYGRAIQEWVKENFEPRDSKKGTPCST